VNCLERQPEPHPPVGDPSPQGHASSGWGRSPVIYTLTGILTNGLLDLVSDHQLSFSTILVGNQIDAPMSVNGSDHVLVLLFPGSGNGVLLLGADKTG
jgi:hypothetical protein